jgi:hypothetical protein
MAQGGDRPYRPLTFNLFIFWLFLQTEIVETWQLFRTCTAFFLVIYLTGPNFMGSFRS